MEELRHSILVRKDNIKLYILFKLPEEKAVKLIDFLHDNKFSIQTIPPTSYWSTAEPYTHNHYYLDTMTIQGFSKHLLERIALESAAGMMQSFEV